MELQSVPQPAQSIWAYSSAKPESGYTRAVQGYASKLAQALHQPWQWVEYTDEASLLEQAMQQGAPSILIGVDTMPDWKGHGFHAPLRLKARPYMDQYGAGPCLHPLTFDQLERAKDTSFTGKTLLLLMANPTWLADQLDARMRALQQQLIDWNIQTLLCLSSPRTNPLLWQSFREELQPRLSHSAITQQWADWQAHPTQTNPYIEWLARADAIMIWGSSRSMAAEALMTKAPVFYQADEHESQQRFMQEAHALSPEMPRRIFSAFDAVSSLPHAQFTPYDVSMIYVEQAVQQFNLSNPNSLFNPSNPTHKTP